ncbi:type II toxin-antitoxin system HigB family toxin [Oscillatoria sp. FACHB-1406]|uniref:type II toxin-antitoxin system HigB family toxin n=1 Tax=Oscillatoria sp. FACHB-1406 TaxID=2692846 RepID=UPI001689CB03|nr:type II toxin-antitoxin system HigB family toxin [Oscillatoria sp. FACHB-1406]MBD2576390.1 type II toxin-antitoxin system HigB family toxin [Oscillatoria sp. FACHB-1406]
MRIISESKLKRFWETKIDSQEPLRTWCKLTKTSNWKNFVEVKQTFSSADIVGKLTIFDIGGNKYRLITFIDYERQKIFIRYI